MGNHVYVVTVIVNQDPDPGTEQGWKAVKMVEGKVEFVTDLENATHFPNLDEAEAVVLLCDPTQHPHAGPYVPVGNRKHKKE